MVHQARNSSDWTIIGLLVASNLALALGILIFASGFFPYKPFLPGVATLEDGSKELNAPFDKVIFMVVDALRSDFVYSRNSGFLFLQRLIRDGTALPFTAHAAPPTITMPKVKAMTTGSIPSFLDVILNFAESDTSSTLTTQDTWLSQLNRKPDGRHVVMYGDDTWLKLFPNFFARADGTSSFFVSDFTEVDNNVTRHISHELENDDWNAMIMHYLGLDHIGHKSGPLSPHMLPKQREMDAIVEQIYTALDTKSHLASTLLVLCGDHGMNDAGNHGGSADGETSPALVFLSPKLATIASNFSSPSLPLRGEFGFYDPVEQSDIAPTLASLLGFPIPLNNLGVIIPRVLDLWPEVKQRLELLFRNAQQMSKIVAATFHDHDLSDHQPCDDCDGLESEASVLWCLWMQSKESFLADDLDTKEQLQRLLKFLRRAQVSMSKTATSYGIESMYNGMALASFAIFCVTTALVLLRERFSGPTFFIVSLALANGMMMFASSFVEEEQHFWYWASSALVAGLYWRSILGKKGTATLHVARALGLAAALRILRRWNQTGQKHAGEADIGRAFLPQHTSMLWLLVTATMLELCRRITSYGLPGMGLSVSAAWALVICLTEMFFKLSFTMADAPELLHSAPNGLKGFLDDRWLITQARVVYMALAAMASFTVYQSCRRRVSRRLSAQSLHLVLTAFLVTQSRINNIPVFLLFFLALECIRGLGLSPDELTLTSIIFQYTSFFALGGSNSISSVDLSNAYNGVSDYNVGAVGMLTFFGNWAGPVWWSMTTLLVLFEGTDSTTTTSIFIKHLCYMSLVTAINVVSVMVACTMLRTHLFIWTVFSPKYLFTIAWTLGQHVIVNLFMGSFFYALCS